jgi:hypothetical protein
MVTVPDRRWEVVFAETEIVTDAAPSPLTGDTFTHEIFSATDHAQPLPQETSTEADAPA